MANDNIYKYTGVNDKLIDSLENKYLWFSKPNFLNDPFDCNLELINSYPIFKKLLEINYSSQEIIDLTKEFGVCSFSKINDSLHLWALYANSHSGICLVFNQEIINNHYSRICGEPGVLTECDYRDSPLELDGNIEWKKTQNMIIKKPIHSIFRDNDVDILFKKILLQKNKDIWKNESEKRIIINGRALKYGLIKEEYRSKKGYKMPLPDNALTEIILGYNVSDENKEMIEKLNKKYYSNKLEIKTVSLDFKEWKLKIQ